MQRGKHRPAGGGWVRAGCVQRRVREATRGSARAVEYEKIYDRLGITKRSFDKFMKDPADKLIDIERADRILIAADGALGMDCHDDVVEFEE